MSSGDKDLIAQQEARDAVESASSAFGELVRFSQSKIDAICDAMSRVALSSARSLGKLANEETGFGRAEDKYEKNRFAAEDVWARFRSLKTVGVVNDRGSIVEIASPRGVVAAIIPSTNPTSTAIFKILISIKSRNSIVLSPHPSAVRCIAETTRVMRDAAIAKGLPPGAIQCLQTSSIEGTETLMKHKLTAVILATGGIGLVRAAYSSGKPAFGVGPGNVPVYIDRSANIKKAVADILTGTCFDNGTICASEQSVVVDRSIAASVRREFSEQGAMFLSKIDAAKVGDVLITQQRTLNAGIVGKTAEFIARLAGVNVPQGTRCLIADCEGVGREHPWSYEKLSPTLAFFEVDGIDEGAALCYEILRFGGMGHTAGLHSSDRAAAIAFGDKMPTARVVINSPTTHGAIGFSTDLEPSMTLGCGSWGGNVTSDNISPMHLMDIKRVAFETKPINIAAPTIDRPLVSGDPTPAKPNLQRDQIAMLVDRFLSEKVGSRSIEPPSVLAENKPVETKATAVIHEITPENAVQKPVPIATVDFVSEDDVRRAIDRGEKIYISKKTIITPSARDLGEEREVFATA